jgi:hypothetical protein
MKDTEEIKFNTIFTPQEDYEFKNHGYSFKHSGDLGDLIYSLPVMRYFGGGELVLNPFGLPSKKYDGSDSGFDNKIIELLRPLLEKQEYISKLSVWNKQRVDLDIDYFRTIEIQKDNLCEKILETFKVPFSESEKPWITCEKKQLAPVVISRSMRYRNDRLIYNHFLQDFDDCVFIGLEDEHQDFEDRFGKIRFHKVSNFLEFAEIINGSEVFIGNQSFGMSLAVGLGKPFLQEYYPIYHDCIFDRKNANYIYVKKLEKSEN